MKVIFLDIDGVMNSSRGKGPYFADMEEAKLLLLKHLIDETGVSGIVLASDRRLSDSYMQEFEEALFQFDIPLLGVTRRLLEDEDTRGKQILDYLMNSKEPIETIVILDDLDEGISDFFPFEYIKVNSYFGLNEDCLQKAKDILN